MAFIKLETSVSRNRKLLDAGPAAAWLWACGLCYCQEGLTDGFIPFAAVRHLGVRGPNGLITKLVRANLWEQCEGGWKVHDYLSHHKSAADVLGLKEERRANGAKGGRHIGQKRRFVDQIPPNAPVVAEANTNPVATASVKQTIKPDTDTDTEADTEAVRVASQPPRPTALIQRRRLDAAFEYGRLYVPNRAHRDLLMLRPGQEPELFAWYEAVCEDWTNGPHKSDSPGADMIRFWKSRYDEKWPASAAVAPVRDTRPQWVREADERKRAKVGA